VNNLAIRRATEDLSSADSLRDVCTALISAFEHNEFDAFELSLQPFAQREALIPASFRPSFDGSYRFEWQKPGSEQNSSSPSTWQLSLSLRGPISGQSAQLTVYRYEIARNLLIDINMLTGEFRTVLADALERAMETRMPEPLLANVSLANTGLAAMSD